LGLQQHSGSCHCNCNCAAEYDPSLTDDMPERSIAERREECCIKFKSDIDAGKYPSYKGADGIAFCCGNTPTSCLFTDGNDFKRMTNERAKAIFVLCAQFHESQHIWDMSGTCPKCPESDTEITLPPSIYIEGDSDWGAPSARRECRALRTELACLNMAIFICFGDTECIEQIRNRITDVDNRANTPGSGACFGRNPYDPYMV